MKRTYTLITVIALTVILASCHRGFHVTTISTSTNGNYKKVEYSGWISFSDDKTAIQSMSPGAYLKFKSNDDDITAKSNSNGVITYEFSGEKTTRLTGEARQILIRAIKMITDQQAKQVYGS